MIKRTKNIFSILLLSIAGVLLTGCHGSKEMSSFKTPDSFDTSVKHEITFWAKNDTNAYQTAIYEKAVKEFEELYPNVTVTIRLYNDYSKIYNDVITNISTNTTPNVCITYPDHIATYMEGANTVVALDDLISDPHFGLAGDELLFDSPEVNELIPSYLSEGILNNNLYAVPFMRSTEAVYINRDFVEKLGYEIPDILTWDFIWEVSEAATKKNADGIYELNGQSTLIPFIYKSTDNFMISMLKQLEAGYSDENGNILIFNDDTTDLLYTIAEHARTGAFSTFKISSYPANFLNAGQCIFAIDSTAGSTWMGSDAPLLDISSDSLVKFETVVRPIPQFDTANPKMISQGPSVCIFNKDDSQEVLASWLFTEYLLTNSIQIPYAETEGYVPVTTKAQNSAEYVDYLSKAGTDTNTYYKVKIDATKMLINNIDNTFVTPVFNGSASLRDAAGSLVENVTKSTRRKQVVDAEYIAKLYDDTTTLYHLESSEAGTDLGPLPKESKILLWTLLIVWIGIGVTFIYGKVKSK